MNNNLSGSDIGSRRYQNFTPFRHTSNNISHNIPLNNISHNIPLNNVHDITYDTFSRFKNSAYISYNDYIMKSPVKFWIEDPSILFQTLEIFPRSEMNDIECLNAMTRVIIIIAAIMFIVKFPAWWIFLCIGIIIVIILWFVIKTQNSHQTEYLRKPQSPRIPKPAIISPIIHVNQKPDIPFRLASRK